MTLFAFAACATLMTAGDAGIDRTTAMRRAFEALVKLQPSLASPRAFKQAAQTPAVARALDALSGVEHGFLSSGSADPGAQRVAHVLTLQVARARGALAGDDVELARSSLRGMSTLCFTCHTLVPASHDFAGLDASLPAELSAYERASFLAATRRFDEALALWLSTLARAPSTAQDATDAINGLRQALTVSVSVKDDPAATLELIDALAKAGGEQTVFSARWLASWRADAVAWQKERFEAKRKSPQQLFTRAKALIDDSHAAVHILADETKTVSLARATAYLSEALKREPAAPWRAEALYELGVATATVRDPMLWGLDSVYFETCVRENPASLIAQRCLTVLSDRTVFGFTGSSGTHLPADVEAQLRDLARLAAPRPNAPPR